MAAAPQLGDTLPLYLSSALQAAVRNPSSLPPVPSPSASSSNGAPVSVTGSEGVSLYDGGVAAASATKGSDYLSARPLLRRPSSSPERERMSIGSMDHAQRSVSAVVGDSPVDPFLPPTPEAGPVKDKDASPSPRSFLLRQASRSSLRQLIGNARERPKSMGALSFLQLSDVAAAQQSPDSPTDSQRGSVVRLPSLKGKTSADRFSLFEGASADRRRSESSAGGESDGGRTSGTDEVVQREPVPNSRRAPSISRKPAHLKSTFSTSTQASSADYHSDGISPTTSVGPPVPARPFQPPQPQPPIPQRAPAADALSLASVSPGTSPSLNGGSPRLGGPGFDSFPQPPSHPSSSTTAGRSPYRHGHSASVSSTGLLSTFQPVGRSIQARIQAVAASSTARDVKSSVSAAAANFSSSSSTTGSTAGTGRFNVRQKGKDITGGMRKGIGLMNSAVGKRMGRTTPTGSRGGDYGYSTAGDLSDAGESSAPGMVGGDGMVRSSSTLGEKELVIGSIRLPCVFLGVRIPPRRGLAFGIPLEECVANSKGLVRMSDGYTHSSAGADELGGDEVSGWMARERLPAVAVRCLEYLEEWGKSEEGVYRVPGRSNHVQLLRALFDAGMDVDLKEFHPGDLDPHAVASVFKAWLRELPDSLLSLELEKDVDALFEQHLGQTATTTQFLGGGGGSNPTGAMPSSGVMGATSTNALAAATSSASSKVTSDFLAQLRDLIGARLPDVHYCLLRALSYHLARLSSCSDTNKMTLMNFRLILSPTLRLSPVMLGLLVEERVGLFDPRVRTYTAPVATRASSEEEELYSIRAVPLSATSSTFSNGTGRSDNKENQGPSDALQPTRSRVSPLLNPPTPPLSGGFDASTPVAKTTPRLRKDSDWMIVDEQDVVEPADAKTPMKTPIADLFAGGSSLSQATPKPNGVPAGWSSPQTASPLMPSQSRGSVTAIPDMFTSSKRKGSTSSTNSAAGSRRGSAGTTGSSRGDAPGKLELHFDNSSSGRLDDVRTEMSKHWDQGIDDGDEKEEVDLTTSSFDGAGAQSREASMESSARPSIDGGESFRKRSFDSGKDSSTMFGSMKGKLSSLKSNAGGSMMSLRSKAGAMATPTLATPPSLPSPTALGLGVNVGEPGSLSIAEEDGSLLLSVEERKKFFGG